MVFPLGRSLARGGRLERAEGGRGRDNIDESRSPASYRLRKRGIAKTETSQRRTGTARDEEIRYVDVVGQGTWTLIERRWG